MVYGHNILQQCYFLSTWNAWHSLKNLVYCVLLLKGRAELRPLLCSSSIEAMKKMWKLSLNSHLLLKSLLDKFREKLRSGIY